MQMDTKKKLLLLLYLAFTLIYLSIAMHLPVSIYTRAGHDDAWFIKAAESMMAGRWLGQYNHMTLIKGPAYAYFIVINNLIGLPITFSIALFYAVACVFTVSVLRPAGVNSLIALGLFLFLLFQPALFPTRIIRDNIYPALTLLTFSGFSYAAITANAYTNRLFIAGTGLMAGLFWIAREEGIWIIPGLILLGIYGVARRIRERNELAAYIKVLVVYFCCACIPIIITGLANYKNYGVFQIVDVKSAAFVNALDALNNVRVADEIPFLPVPEKKREAIYKVSPAFKELEPYFTDVGKRWTNYGCAIYKNTCGDYAAGWFMWALRDGVSSLGYYTGPKAAAGYYKRLTAEVRQACKDGRLQCANSMVPFMPGVTPAMLRRVPEKLSEAVALTFYATDAPLNGGPSGRPPERLTEIRDLLGNPRIIPAIAETKLQVSGWYYSPTESWIHLQCSSDGLQTAILIQRQDSPDIAKQFEDTKAAHHRFSFAVPESERCSINFTDQPADAIPLASLSNNPMTIPRQNNGISTWTESNAWIRVFRFTIGVS
jgi:hypothetical protein